MNRIAYIKAFNDLLDQFYDHLAVRFPLFKSDITLAKTCTEFLRNSNPRQVVEQFMRYISPYSEHINNCDEKFFLDFEHNIKKEKEGLSQSDILFGVKLKQVWMSEEITEMDKARIWNYFQKLIKLGSKAMA